jgi:CRISPR-associated protein (TIGR03986 family)
MGDLCREAATLPILSAPKPTTVRFYLAPTGGDLRSTARESGIGYDSADVAIRGRKFYRRRNEVDMDAPAAGNQNRTIRDYLDEDATTTFQVHFENLARVELGALLWALELDAGDWVHRLGYGKPLGMGDVRIAVESLALFTDDRYAADAGEATMPRADPGEAKGVFRQAMARRYNGARASEAEFQALPNVQDFRALLHDLPKLPVRYPLLPSQLVPGNEPPRSYEWFVVNRGGRFQGRSGRGHWLDFAAEDQGLPNDPTIP